MQTTEAILSSVPSQGDWRSDLPTVRGRYAFGASLAEQTWFRVGGKADLLYKPADVDDLIYFLQNKPDIPYYVLGAGSNVLIRDGGIRGIVIRLGRGFSSIEIKDDCVEVGAGALDRTVALTCAEHGLGGLEFLVGIPGTIGGAVRMNAGCYGKEIRDVLEWVDIIDSQGKVMRRRAIDLDMTYRHTNMTPDQIVIKACFRGELIQPMSALPKIQKLLAEREESQPVRGRTGGSTFRNPVSAPDQNVGADGIDYSKAWQLIDLAGCRGMQVGHAQVSTKHCNFLMNVGEAKAADLELLGDTVRQKVKEASGVDLQWEIIRMGERE